jgi:hypothetical protein
MNDNGPDTLRIKNLDKTNELDYVQYMYDQALSAYLKQPSYENRRVFLEANDRLIDTRWAYRKGAELMGTFRRKHYTYSSPGVAKSSQDIHAL